MSFVRSRRYEVLKLKDIAIGLTHSEQELLQYLIEKVKSARKNAGKQPLDCVVVESDWPEYESTWLAIQQRVERMPTLSEAETIPNPNNKPLLLEHKEDPDWFKNLIIAAGCVDLPPVLLASEKPIDPDMDAPIPNIDHHPV